MKKNVKISDLQEGEIRHPVLPEVIIERIKTFKGILGDVEPSSLEQTIDSFKRDMHPERELIIWERIASTYQTYLAHNPTDDPEIKNEILCDVSSINGDGRLESH